MYFIKRIIIGCIAVAAISCSKQASQVKQEQDARNTITGSWQWLRTNGGIAFNMHDTPRSTGKTIKLAIRSNGTYAVFTNNAVTSQGTYALEKRTCIHDHAEKWYILFSADQNMMVEKTENGMLYLSDERYDGIGVEYAWSTGS